MVTILLAVAAALLVGLGAPMASSWTVQGMRRHLRHNAADRRGLEANLRVLREPATVGPHTPVVGHPLGGMIDAQLAQVTHHVHQVTTSPPNG